MAFETGTTGSSNRNVPPTPRDETATQETVRYLRRTVGLAERDLAIATGASTRTVRRWLAADVANAHPRHTARLLELRAVVAVLLDLQMKSYWTAHWLRGRKPVLGSASPLERLAAGDLKSVLLAARGVVEDSSAQWMLRPASTTTPGVAPAVLVRGDTSATDFAAELAALDLSEGP